MIRKKELVARLIIVEVRVATLTEELRATRLKLSRAIDDINVINRRQRDRQ